MFFNNLRRTASWILESKISGVKVKVTQEILANTFSIPLLESPILEGGVVHDEDYDNLEALNSMSWEGVRREA